MNDEILERHMLDDAQFQNEMREWKKTVLTKEEAKEVIVEGLNEYFKNKGKLTFTVIVSTATLVGALIVILGGFKTVLGWLGFQYLNK